MKLWLCRYNREGKEGETWPNKGEEGVSPKEHKEGAILVIVFIKVR